MTCDIFKVIFYCLIITPSHSQDLYGGEDGFTSLTLDVALAMVLILSIESSEKVPIPDLVLSRQQLPIGPSGASHLQYEGYTGIYCTSSLGPRM